MRKGQYFKPNITVHFGRKQTKNKPRNPETPPYVSRLGLQPSDRSLRTPCGTRTRNLRIRGPTPCPLGQEGDDIARGKLILVRFAADTAGLLQHRAGYSRPRGLDDAGHQTAALSIRPLRPLTPKNVEQKGRQQCCTTCFQKRGQQCSQACCKMCCKRRFQACCQQCCERCSKKRC